jgi:structure-specific endonuclease subunit SLX4 (BTB/POZ domain-containing protein 12)
MELFIKCIGISLLLTCGSSMQCVDRPHCPALKFTCFPIRFGVRPLPKRQMVLKLKEIFQYTHQTLESDSEDEIQSSQVPLEVPCSQTLATKTYKPSRAGGHTQIKGTVGPGTQSSKGSTKTKGPQPRKQQPSESIPHPSRSSASELPPGPDGDAQLSASQESVATSVDSSDSSFSLQR